MKRSIVEKILLQLALLLLGNLVAGQENTLESASHERDEPEYYFINSAAPPEAGQESSLDRLIRSSFAPGLRLAQESAARQQRQRQIERQLGRLIDQAYDEQQRQRRLDRQQQMAPPQLWPSQRRQLEQVLEQLNKNHNTDNNDLLPQGRPGDGEQPTRTLMVRQLDALATPTRTGEAERKRRVSSVLPSRPHGRSVISLNTEQLSALQSPYSLIGADPGYKPKSISTARGFGK